MRCADCRFAEWERTATGRLSPKGRGLCNWRKTVRVAASCISARDKTRVEFWGGTIWRKDDPMNGCPVFAHTLREPDDG